MSLQSYIEKLRAKPVHERKRIAIGVTIVGFFLFAAIWVVSLKEMNKSVEPQADQTSASLDDLKNNFQDNLQTGKDSIQNMMQQLPSDTSSAAPTDNSGSQPGNDSLNWNDSTSNPESIPMPAESESGDQNNQDKPAVPQLP